MKVERRKTIYTFTKLFLAKTLRLTLELEMHTDFICLFISQGIFSVSFGGFRRFLLEISYMGVLELTS